ncbi:MAG: hypothetical protein Q9220_000589 [cf. Caloplaca sp. 1 TL-2023]
MNSVALVGGTGLVGTQILTALQSLPSTPTIHALARRDLPTSSQTPNTKPTINPDTSSWPSLLKSLTPPPTTFLSALGTTRAQAGSFAAQRTIDYDLNLSLARAAASSAGDRKLQTYVLISSGAVSTTSRFPYSKMKADLEESVKELKSEIPHIVILKPGLLVGHREDVRPPEAVLRYIAIGLGKISKPWLMDWWAQDVETIGRAAVAAAVECAEGRREEGVWVVGAAEIIRLGRQGR